MKEPHSNASTPRRRSTPHSAPAAWLAHDRTPAQDEPDPDQLRAAIELVLAHPDAVVEVITRGRAHPVRHDGWTGERMATFLEVLADTGIVTEASRAVGMHRDGAYALRNRDPIFAAAWRAAQTKARPQVADGLLERSITGTVEHYYRDGVLVGERRHYESWLGLAVLKRLDKLAEEDRADASLSARMAGDWQGTLDMLRDGGTAALPARFTPKVDKLDTPPSPPGWDLAENCWQVGAEGGRGTGRRAEFPDGTWLTCFPPPLGFDGYQNIEWDGDNWYERTCTPEEVELLEAHAAAVLAEERAELAAFAEEQRDGFFARLRAELAAIPAAGPAPALTPERGSPSCPSAARSD